MIFGYFLMAIFVFYRNSNKYKFLAWLATCLGLEFDLDLSLNYLKLDYAIS